VLRNIIDSLHQFDPLTAAASIRLRDVCWQNKTFVLSVFIHVPLYLVGQLSLIFWEEPGLRQEPIHLVRENPFGAVKCAEERAFAAHFTRAHIPREPALAFANAIKL